MCGDHGRMTARQRRRRPGRRPSSFISERRRAARALRAWTLGARALLLLSLVSALARIGQALRWQAPYFDHRQPALAQLVVVAPGHTPRIAPLAVPPRASSSNHGLVAAMAAGFLRDGLPANHQQPQHQARLLETATAGMSQTTGEEWVLFALVGARLAPQAKASLVGARFLAALVHDLPSRLEMLEPAHLASLVNGWPRDGLDDWSRRVIQAVIEASIDRLGAFQPSDLAHLAKGLCRPITMARIDTLQCLDRLAEETPDLNSRSRLFKAGVKVLSRRVTELDASGLAALAHACASEMSLQDWCKDLGPAFPRAYTRAVAAQLDAFTLQELSPVLSGFLFLRAAFHSTPDANLLESLGERVVAMVKGQEEAAPAPGVVLSLLVAFAHLGAMNGSDSNGDVGEEEAARYNPTRVIDVLTAQAHGVIDQYPPEAAGLLLETLALPGHAYRPRAAALAALTQRAAAEGDVLAALDGLVRVTTRGATAEAEGAVGGLAKSVQGFLRLRFGGGEDLKWR